MAIRSLAALAGAVVLLITTPTAAHTGLLEVSYGPVRDSFSGRNAALADQHKGITGQSVVVRLSPGGPGKPSRSIPENLDADVATPTLAPSLRPWFAKVPVPETATRAETTIFGERGIENALIAGETEDGLAVKENGPRQDGKIVPSAALLAEPSVTLIDRYADKHGTHEIARRYLDFLYSPAGPGIAASEYHLPRAAKTAESGMITALAQFDVDEVFASWRMTHAAHCGEGASFDHIFTRR